MVGVPRLGYPGRFVEDCAEGSVNQRVEPPGR